MTKKHWIYIKLRFVLCLLLVLVLSGLSTGCSRFFSLFTPEYQRRTVAFDEMTYKRPNFNALCKNIENLTNKIKQNKDSYRKQLNALQDLNTGYWDYYTMYVLAQIRYSINTQDQYFYKECLFFNETSPQLAQKLDSLYVACSQSPHCDRFEKDYFGVDYLDQYRDGESYSDRLVELMQQESQLVLSYKEQTADPVLTYEGQIVSLTELLAYAETEAEFNQIITTYYPQANASLSLLYADLVRIRLQIAKELGYDSYAEYAYESLSRDYNAATALNFITEIEKELVPLYKELSETDFMASVSLASISYKDVPGLIGDALSGVHSSVREAYSFMEKYGLYDIAPSDKKVTETFTTYIENYDAPFILMNSTGSAEDLLTLAHEFGHFTDMYLNYNMGYSLDQSECASQAMEYLLLEYLPDSQKSLRDALTAYKMNDTLALYVTQGCYTYFEHQVYGLSEEEVSAERINEIAEDCANRFGLTEDAGWFACTWALVPHFYEQAFYCISYCISNHVALQIYQAEYKAPGRGAKIYMDFIDWDLDMTFMENVARVGLKNPCERGSIQEIAHFLNMYYRESGALAA